MNNKPTSPKFKRQWTGNSDTARRQCPYVMVAHEELHLTYFLNRNYDLIWDEQFSVMLRSEEEHLKRFLERFFIKNQVQEWEGWTPSGEWQMPKKCRPLKADEFKAYWIKDWRELDTVNLTGLLFIGRELIGY